MKVHVGTLTIKIPLLGLTEKHTRDASSYYLKQLKAMGSFDESCISFSVDTRVIDVDMSEQAK